MDEGRMDENGGGDQGGLWMGNVIGQRCPSVGNFHAQMEFQRKGTYIFLEPNVADDFIGMGAE